MKIYREPIGIGKYYNASMQELSSQIRNMFLEKKFGPGSEPQTQKTDEFKAFIIPHTYYDKCGYAMAHAYKKIFENSAPDTIVILGPDHDGMGFQASVFPKGFFMTPLGDAEIDSDFNEILLKKKGFTPDELIHSDDYGIETQLPIIKWQYGDKAPKIVPLLLSMDYACEELDELAQSLYNAWIESGKRILFIASTNFSKAGLKYGYIPFTERGKELNEKIKKMDEGLAKLLCELKIKEAIEYAKKYKINACGLNCIILLAKVLEKMKQKKIKGKILKQYTSADLDKYYDNFTDYIAMEFN